MNLIIHKPRNSRIPVALLEVAVRFNPDGWGSMGLGHDGESIVERRLRSVQYCPHLGLRTPGNRSRENVQPIKVSDRFCLMHNGTLPLAARVPGLSDSRHPACDVLRPLAASWPGLFADPAFQRLLEMGLRPENKVALPDLERRRFVLVNRHHGAGFEGLWPSSTRWIDSRVLSLAGAPQLQQRSYDVARLGFHQRH